MYDETIRAIDWRGGKVVIIDQTQLPGREVLRALATVDELIGAIRTLAIRGAPSLGIAGALGVALAARQADREHWHEHRLEAELDRLEEARPTAVNLAWGISEARALIPDGAAAVERRALDLLQAEGERNRLLGERGADLLEELLGRRQLRVQTHCNTGALACVEWGTALGVARTLHARGRLTEVLVTETRPLLQGARLTTWELARLGIAHRLVCDAAAPAAIAGGLVDAVVVGADRIAANGDVANKIGTFGLALAASRARIPMIVAAPEPTIDLETATGADIEIEMRDEREVLGFGDAMTATSGTRALNPAFDITPADLVTAVVTDARIIRPALGETPERGSTSSRPRARSKRPRAVKRPGRGRG